MKFEDAKDLTDSLRDHFFRRLKAKTGWGRDELKLEFERAISDTFIAEWDRKEAKP